MAQCSEKFEHAGDALAVTPVSAPKLRLHEVHAFAYLFVLHENQVGIHHVLPPVIGNTPRPPGDFGQVLQPPLMVGTDLATAPFGRTDLADLIVEIWEVVPVVAVAGHQARVVPIVIPLAIGSEMD